MNSQKIEAFRKSMRAIERDIFSQFKDGTSCCGISLAQCHVILEIGLRKLTNISQLSENLSLDKSTLSRTIDGLVNLNFIERASDPNDRRFMKLSLTKAGGKIFNTINDFCNQDYQNIFDHIPKEKHDQVIESIFLLSQAMTEMRKNKLQEESTCSCTQEKET
jgi:DNA-binding MarR family transcriptional regulator